jgi:hypothetical protein
MSRSGTFNLNIPCEENGLCRLSDFLSTLFRLSPFFNQFKMAAAAQLEFARLAATCLLLLKPDSHLIVDTGQSWAKSDPKICFPFHCGPLLY